MADSFSQDTKEALSVLPCRTAHCQRAELAAVFAGAGSYEVDENGRLFPVVQSGSAAVLRRADFLVRALTKTAPDVSVLQSGSRKAPLYTLILRHQPAVETLLKSLGYMTDRGVAREFALAPADSLFQRECCRKAYLRGAFLAGGFVGDPLTSYHLEILPGGEETAALLQKLSRNFGLPLRRTKRKGQTVLYLKDSGAIADFLSLIGAYKARLEWENVRIYRGLQGDVNRQVNCETGNIAKTVTAGRRQIEAIRTIERRRGLASLPEPLQEMARLRLEYPELSLGELGTLLNPPIGKSGVSHRLRRLEKIASE